MGRSGSQFALSDAGQALSVVLLVLLEGGRHCDCVVVVDLDAVALVD